MLKLYPEVYLQKIQTFINEPGKSSGDILVDAISQTKMFFPISL